MYNDSLKIFLFTTAIYSIPILLLSIFLAVRAKSFQAGLRIFMLLLGLLVVVQALIDIFISMPGNVLRTLNIVMSSMFLIFTCIAGILYWINVKNSGNLLGNSSYYQKKLRPLYILGITQIIAVLAGIIIYKGRNLPEATFVWMLFAGISFGKIFFSFQFREKGIVYKGRLIRFDDILSMEWEHLLRKDKAKIITNSGKTMALKVPWELLTPVDNYIQSHFPRE